jgi:eukaryotic translation initiation factor 2C
MLQVPATVLPYPQPRYGNGAVVLKGSSWNLRNRQFFLTRSKTVVKGFIIAVPRDDSGKSTLRDLDFLKETWNNFKSTMQKVYTTAMFQFEGYAMNPDFERSKTTARVSMDMAKAKGANFVMLLLDKKSTYAYSAFKDLADRQYGMHSLCIVWDPKKGFGPQYWGNIAMKMNLKAGGINHTADGLEHIMKDTLVLGA